MFSLQAAWLATEWLPGWKRSPNKISRGYLAQRRNRQRYRWLCSAEERQPPVVATTRIVRGQRPDSRNRSEKRRLKFGVQGKAWCSRGSQIHKPGRANAPQDCPKHTEKPTQENSFTAGALSGSAIDLDKIDESLPKYSLRYLVRRRAPENGYITNACLLTTASNENMTPQRATPQWVWMYCSPGK